MFDPLGTRAAASITIRAARVSATSITIALGAIALAASVVARVCADHPGPPASGPLAWGSDHVGQELPAFVSGDECLFCHRRIGSTWSENPHQQTIRPAWADSPAMAALKNQAGPAVAAEVEYLMGAKRITRFLKRSSQYGKLQLLKSSSVPEPEPLSTNQQPSATAHAGQPWDESTFADRCAGCHTTAVDTATRAFSAISLDCFACHGDVNLQHANDVSQVLLSSQCREPRQVVSLCGQCHLRGGKSASTGLPYPNTFVAGDNLFRDFQVDFSDEAIGALPQLDQHIFLNARDVALLDRRATDCITCHNVHGRNSERHQALETASICVSCHPAGTDNAELYPTLSGENKYRTHSSVCDF